jgi:triacylglycerol esterase/lipase EstA (alpha/beta hydrolase family)
MSNAKHLVVLIHGLNGYASDLEVLSTQLIVSGFEVYLPEQNQGKTSDGIAICARRLLDGVILRIKDVKATKISIIGYAIGGLFARYLIGLLFKTKIIPETLTPMNYICINAPHLGSRADRLGFLGLLLDETQKDLMLNSRGDKDPVLLEMVNDLFLSSLQTFQTHTSYSPHELQNGFSSEGLVHNNQNSSQDLLKIEGIIIKRLNKINWKKITYIQRSISETNFWLSKPGISVTTDILERITENSLSHSNPTRRKSIKQQPIHMVVLIHGLDGFNTDMEFISQKLSDRYQIPIYTFCPECNHNQTHDGISNGAKRILEAVKKELITRNVKFISLVAHSLGGLYARCLVGLLFEEGVIPNRVIPLNFITLASPHLGSREHGKMVGDRLMSFMGSIIGLTGKGIVKLNRIDFK